MPGVLDLTRVVGTAIPTARLVSLSAGKFAEERAAAAYEAKDFEAMIGHLLEARRHGLNTVQVHMGLGTAYMKIGRNRESIQEYREAVRRGSRSVKLWNNLIFLLDLQPETTLETALEARKAWWRNFGAPLRSTWRKHPNDPDPERPLRIGYVSGDFRRHSAAEAFSPVVLRHSEGYRAVCYSTCPDEDEITALFEKEAAAFYRIEALDEAALAERVRADGIDILVDLSGHSALNRLETFCRRPAPVQVTGWGYALGTGLPVMDGFFADEITVPRAFKARGYAEPILYLPSVIPCTPMPYSDPVQPMPCLTRGYFTFGSFNRWAKITPLVLTTWAEILAATPGSRLLLKEKAYEREDIRQQVLAAMAAKGVAADRIEFRGWTPHVDHLRAYHEVDVALDPFPHSGGVTALEGLWHGVAPVNLLGDRVMERLSASFCHTLNLPAFVTTSRHEYITTAVLMATQFQAQLADIRASLQYRIAESPMCQGYVAAVETHYRDLWRAWCRRSTA